tara:strand:+ start:336 stop:803 length:468 start_codon:yes stop_codon:yes gene_type:complete
LYELGGRKSLQVAFSVLNQGCGGCQYEHYPYEAQLPIIIDGKRPTWEFKSDEDVWKVIDLIIQETKDFNLENNKDFDVGNSVYTQLPFFGCRNILNDSKIQKDIQRYIYCEKFNVKPFNGSYGEQPYLWIETSLLIRKYMAKIESKQIESAKKPR